MFCIHVSIVSYFPIITYNLLGNNKYSTCCNHGYKAWEHFPGLIFWLIFEIPQVQGLPVACSGLVCQVRWGNEWKLESQLCVPDLSFQHLNTSWVQQEFRQCYFTSLHESWWWQCAGLGEGHVLSSCWAKGFIFSILNFLPVFKHITPSWGAAAFPSTATAPEGQQSPSAVLREVPKASLDALGCRCAQGMGDKGRWKQRKIMGLKEKKSKRKESLYEHQCPSFHTPLTKGCDFLVSDHGTDQRLANEWIT